MKIVILGSCSGTEPYLGRCHTSWVLEHEGRLYWFDAGECCSRTAYFAGLDLRKTSQIFISHSHMDHIGGLPGILWNIAKLHGVKKTKPAPLKIYISDLRPFRAICDLLDYTEFKSSTLPIQASLIRDGILFNGNGVIVEAMHNLHLPPLENGLFRSYSFRITAGGKRIVYSGDIKNVSDLDPWLKNGCAVFMMESGHHAPCEVAEYLEQRHFKIETLLFVHHGRLILV